MENLESSQLAGNHKLAPVEVDLNNDLNLKTETNQVRVGTIQEAPDFLQDNEFIIKGYRINCNSIKNVMKSLFVLHNESVNIWSHLVGSLFVGVLVVYTTMFIKAHGKELINFELSLNFTQISQDIKESTSPIFEVFSEFPNVTDAISHEYTNSKIVIHSLTYSIYNKTSEFIETITDKIGIVQGYLQCKQCLEIIGNAIEQIKISLQENVMIYTDILVQESFQIFQIEALREFLDSFNTKVGLMEGQFWEMLEMNELDWNNHYLKSTKRVKRWPLFVMLICAIICLSWSAIFHWFSAHSKRLNDLLNRLDYAGISILIAGSCYPPYFFFFYCETFLRNMYLAFISVFAITVFIYSFKPDFNTPPQRKLRGALFLTLGLSSGLPILHLALFSNYIAGFDHTPRLLFWYLGGMSYVTGALIYINRFPEKFRPGKHDIWGSSHQIFHFFVLLGVIMHYLGSLDSYYYRVAYACPEL